MFSFIENSRFDVFGDAIRTFIVHQGIFAPIFLLILEEAGIPLPIPGDFIIAYTGYQVKRGHISYVTAFLLTLISVLIGSSILYYISDRYGQKLVLRVGKYIHLNEKRLILVEEQFRKYGILVIIFGRHIPGFRIPITVFSGMSNITYRTFILSTFVSVVFWVPFYLSVGQRLGPRTGRLLHGHPVYYFLAAIPFVAFVASIIFVQITQHANSKKK